MSFTVNQVELLDANPELVKAARLFEVQFASETHRIAESEVPITTSDGKRWVQGFDWIEAAPVTAGDPLEAQPAIYKVAEHLETLIEDALHNRAEWYDAPVNQYMQLYSDNQLVGPPVLLHSGFIKDIVYRESNEEESLTIRAETLFTIRNYTPLGDYTDRDQQRRSPGDKGCEFPPSLVDKVIKGWLIG